MLDIEKCGWLGEASVADVLTEEVDTLPPGVDLAAILADLDTRHLSGHDAIVALRAHRRMVSFHTAKMYETMMAIVDALDEGDFGRDVATQAAAAEVRLALTLTRRAADHEMATATELEERHPHVRRRLEAGEIDQRRCRVIIDGTSHLPDDVAGRVSRDIIDVAGELTTGQLAHRLRKVCLAADPDDAAARYRRSIEDRSVVAFPNPAGTATLVASDLAPDQVARITDRLTSIARSLRRDGEPRTMDQLRADVFADLLLGGSLVEGVPSGRRGAVDLRVDLTTLARLDDAPGELAGYGPVVADVARQVAGESLDAEWRFTVLDPETGRVLTTGTTRRRPTTGQRRRLETAHPTCVFPGCRMPASRCDLDHTVPFSEDGPTTVDNLAPLCRHDHRIRHHPGWEYRATADGGFRWTTALGHVYTTSPP